MLNWYTSGHQKIHPREKIHLGEKLFGIINWYAQLLQIGHQKIHPCEKIHQSETFLGITNWYAQLVQLRAPENTSWYRWRKVEVFWRPGSMLILGWGQRVIISHATMLNAAALFLPHAHYTKERVLHAFYCTLHVARCILHFTIPCALLKITLLHTAEFSSVR